MFISNILPKTVENHIQLRRCSSSSHHLGFTKLLKLHSCDYLKETSTKTNVATDEGNNRNEMWHLTNDEIGVAV